MKVVDSPVWSGGVADLNLSQQDAMRCKAPPEISSSPGRERANGLNQVTALNFGAAFSYRPAHDVDGNLAGDGALWSYSFDTENRLIGAALPSLTASFTYDPLGCRASKAVSGDAPVDGGLAQAFAEVYGSRQGAAGAPAETCCALCSCRK